MTGHSTTMPETTMPETTMPETTMPETTMATAPMQTEFPFSLPRGYLDADGTLHREGVMRLATAYDEIAPMKDPRVQANPGYLTIILLSRVVERLGDLEAIHPKVVERLFAADLAYLQEVYRQINDHGHRRLVVDCPFCEQEIEVEIDVPGE